MTANDAVAEVIRIEGARIVATVVRLAGDWSLAEDAVQEAAAAALREWTESGIPDHPRAWMITVARRKAIDLVRREASRRSKESEGAALMAWVGPIHPPDSVFDDDLLKLIFTCCHPSLAPQSRMALALRTLCQLSTHDIADVMLSSEAAVTKRLTRTRHKIAVAGIPYRVPDDAMLPERLGGVCGVIYSLYTVGHGPHRSDLATRPDLCAEGLRLARLLHQLMPDETTAAGLLALILLTQARQVSRTDASGEIVLLHDQDRTVWDQSMIIEGTAMLHQSLRRSSGIADPYQLLAGIAVEHDQAASYDDTDWAEIIRLYDLLVSVRPSQPTALARAVALAERDGPDPGLVALEAVEASPRREAIRADVLARLGRFVEAIAALDLSLTEDLSDPERRYRERLRRRWSGTLDQESSNGLPGAADGRAPVDAFDPS